MRSLFLRYPNRTRRFFEILIPFTSWILITMPFWLSFWHPAIVAYLIITFDVYWFYKSFRLAIHAIRSFLMISAHTKVDWVALTKNLPDFNKLYHVVIVPEYQEPIHVLERTLTNLAQQDFPKERIIVVLATEDKDPHARNRKNSTEEIWESFWQIHGHATRSSYRRSRGEIIKHGMGGKKSCRCSPGLAY